MTPLQQPDTTERRSAAPTRESEQQLDRPVVAGPAKLPAPYLYFAILLTNALCLFLLLNVVLGVGFYIRDYTAPQEQTAKPVKQTQNGFFNTDGSPVDNGKRNLFQLDWFDFSAYEGITPEYAADVLDGFFALGELGLVYQPWTGFSEPPFSSKLVNVQTDDRRFPIRRTINPKVDAQLPTIYIFTMGGSPTFGYNVSDEHTWPSQLSKILNSRAESDRLGVHVEVVNYGRGYYYPSQETALLIDLLKNGHQPSLVIFMDGTNQGPADDAPIFTEELAVQMRTSRSPKSIIENLDWLPIARFASAFRRRLFDATRPPPPVPQQVDHGDPIDIMVNRFNRNQEISAAVAKVYGTQTLFFVQPNAMYNYPAQLYRLSLPGSFVKQRDDTQKSYQRLLKDQTGRIDLSDLFEEWGNTRKAIVDNVHYSPAFNEFLAQHVAKYVDLKSLASRPSANDPTKATGEPRTPLSLNGQRP
jgi:hypothetical protein